MDAPVKVRAGDEVRLLLPSDKWCEEPLGCCRSALRALNRRDSSVTVASGEALPVLELEPELTLRVDECSVGELEAARWPMAVGLERGADRPEEWSCVPLARRDGSDELEAEA